MEGHHVVYILLETGCSKTLVREQLVLEEKLLEGQAVTIRCAHGDTVLHPLAEVDMEVDGVPVRVEAALCSTLPMSVLLGTDVPEISRLLGGASGQQLLGTAMSVMTHQQARELREEEATQRAKEQESSAHATLRYMEKMGVVSVRWLVRSIPYPMSLCLGVSLMRGSLREVGSEYA